MLLGFDASFAISFTSCADFEGKVVKTSVVFNKLGATIPMSVDEGPESQGPVVS